MTDPVPMRCAAIDIGSNTTRVLVAEPAQGQLKKVMEQRAYTQIGKSTTKDGVITQPMIHEIGEVVATQLRLAEELGADVVKAVATAAIREAPNRDEVLQAISEVAGLEVAVLNEQEEGRLAFIGATKTLGHPVKGRVAVVDVGGGSSEIVVGTVAAGADEVLSFRIGSGMLAQELLHSDPPSAAELSEARERINGFFDGVKVAQPDHAVAVGGSATSLRRLVGAVLEYGTLERGLGVLADNRIEEVARRFELDPRRVRILPAGVLLLERISRLLGQPLQIGLGGLREGVVLDLFNRHP